MKAKLSQLESYYEHCSFLFLFFGRFLIYLLIDCFSVSKRTVLQSIKIGKNKPQNNVFFKFSNRDIEHFKTD